jgi:hypothetical protein
VRNPIPPVALHVGQPTSALHPDIALIAMQFAAMDNATHWTTLSMP